MELMPLRVLEIVCAVTVLGVIGWQVYRNLRRLNAGVRAFKAEQEKQDGPLDPYAALTALYTPDSSQRPDRRP